MMQTDFITLLEHAIPYTYVSVLNTPETTEYYIDLTDPEDEDELNIILSCQYAAVTANGISGVYTMYINGDIAMQATKRVLNYIPASKQPAQRKAKKNSHRCRQIGKSDSYVFCQGYFPRNRGAQKSYDKKRIYWTEWAYNKLVLHHANGATK